MAKRWTPSRRRARLHQDRVSRRAEAPARGASRQAQGRTCGDIANGVSGASRQAQIDQVSCTRTRGRSLRSLLRCPSVPGSRRYPSRTPCRRSAASTSATLRALPRRDSLRRNRTSQTTIRRSYAHEMTSLRLACLLVVGLIFGACGSDGPPPPDCTGTSCTCPAASECDLGDSGCAGASCTLSCASDSRCTGSCGQSCSVTCAGSSECDLTVGPSGSVGCTGGSTCTVRCEGSCSLSCSGDSTCKLQCASDTAPRAVTGSAQCG